MSRTSRTDVYAEAQLVTGLMVGAPPAAAQLSARTDVAIGSRYVWHGVSREERAAVIAFLKTL